MEATRLKNIGNELFKQQKYEEAIIQYAAAIGRLCARIGAALCRTGICKRCGGSELTTPRAQYVHLRSALRFVCG